MASTATAPTVAALRSQFMGIDSIVPTVDGRTLPYVELDNAATTPPLRPVLDAVEQFLPFNASVHRGTGYKSQYSTRRYEEARASVGRFVGADERHSVVIFTKNTTEAINRLARSMVLSADAVVLTTVLEHHSNLLPWRRRAAVEHVRAQPDGSLDEDHLDALLRRHRGRLAVLAVTGASNVTGVIQPVHRLAERVHEAGGRIVVDAAQLVAHRELDVRPHDDPAHLDAVAFSAHKMYAPFGSGALVADRAMFGAHPDHVGGGTVRAVTLDEVAWADLPDREEAGTPNVVGAVALEAAARWLATSGLQSIASHERELVRYATPRLAAVPGLKLYGPRTGDRVGVLPFTVDGLDHAFVAAVLGFEHGIGVRNGCFCAHPYVGHLLGLGRAASSALLERVAAGDRRDVPGLVRVSLGCHNRAADIDRLVDALEALVAGRIRAAYRQLADGSFTPVTGVDVPKTGEKRHHGGFDRR
jgi:cysteine desulfurase / selenocysteine lyase